MKTQILYIHGGNSYSTHEKYIDSLKTKTIWDPNNTVPQKRWRETIYTAFKESCDIFYPQMPNSQNAKYLEWKIWFERYFEYLTGEVILIGHSQGGYFLIKYLSENTTPFPVKALFLVASPSGPDDFNSEDGGDFAFNSDNLSNIEKQTSTIILYHSTDDLVVPYSHAENLKNGLPHSKLITLTDRGHFIGPEFPEIIEEIRKIL
jgi:uncharacterized protein